MTPMFRWRFIYNACDVLLLFSKAVRLKENVLNIQQAFQLSLIFFFLI